MRQIPRGRSRKTPALPALFLVAGLLSQIAPLAQELQHGSGNERPAHLVAVFPVENLTGGAIPADDFGAELSARLADSGVTVVDAGDLDAFLARQRIRWTGGVTAAAAQALASELGVTDILITSVDQFQDGPPRIGFTLRLARVEAGEIVLPWAKSVTKSGDDAPGLLGLGYVDDLAVLTDTALQEACGALTEFLSGGEAGETAAEPPARRFRPRVFHAVLPRPLARSRVAVLPFVNDSPRRLAGDVLADRLVAELVAAGVRVVEPGEIRKVLIEARLIQRDGLDYAQAQLLRDLLATDLVVTGRVFQLVDSLDAQALPLVEFSTTALETRGPRVAWVSFSSSRGEPRFRFFGLGTVRSASRLADELVRGLVAVAAGAEPRPSDAPPEPGASSPSRMMSGRSRAVEQD